MNTEDTDLLILTQDNGEYCLSIPDLPASKTGGRTGSVDLQLNSELHETSRTVSASEFPEETSRIFWIKRSSKDRS